ncbi:MAG TPA: hypothetical protein EYH45_02785 [Candidatus Caldiarchaeum subterraneum]|uniref:Uncharacterized protein n=1 Tax=Caldiarchaeum subterraneum TaxID=311458 RepID=A0A832ZV89_CALS0|nr:hypothetical protein [Candidatus Caldarchaeum subterraneum]
MNPLTRGILSSIMAFLLYLLIVVATTPNLPASTAIATTLRINFIFLIIFITTFFVNGYLTGLAMQNKTCRINKKATGSTTIGGAALSSIVSFLPLTSAGCCGMWLWILSLIAGTGALGTAFVSTLIEYPLALLSMGLAIMWTVNTYTYIKYKNTKQKYENN